MIKGHLPVTVPADDQFPWIVIYRGTDFVIRKLLADITVVFVEAAVERMFNADEVTVPAVQPFGARFLTMRSSKVYPHESGLEQGTVIVEFESYESALAAYKSEAYKKALQALGSGAERDFRIVDGA